MSKRFLLTLLVIILGFGGIFWLTSDKKEDGSTSAATVTNHVYGEGAKGITLLEYGDFQCPACYSYYPVVKAVVEKYKADIYFQFRHFPLVQIHQNAYASSRAAEAADKQGKFWEMYDKLYQNQDPTGQSGWVASSTPMTFFTQFATEIGLNADQFTTDYNSEEINDRISADLKEAQNLKFNSTPTFLLDGVQIADPPSPNDQAGWEKLIEDAIAAKSAQ
ncbi:MAG: DsbA family protein [Candidatus Saccharibacteria bacterium]|nr:DsbA family protein [Candidatus Saccharibacteria bacterium]